VLGPDVAWQIDDAWRVRGQWLHSDSTAQPDPAGATLVRGKDTAGDSVAVKASRYTDRVQLDFTDLDTRPQFRHDTGSSTRSTCATWSCARPSSFAISRPSTNCG
jgi:hypothetical protein